MLKTLVNLKDEDLKEATASEIIKASKIDLDAEIDRISSEWKEKKDKVDNELKAAQDAQAKSEKELNETKEQLTKVQEDLNKLIKAAQDKEAEDTFNARMNYFDSTFNLDEKSRNAVANRIKNLDEAGYKQEKEDLEVLLANKKKETEEEKKAKETKESKASVEDKNDKSGEQAIDNAIDKGEKKAAAVAATTTVTETQAQKFAKAFGKDAWVIKTNKR